ncbi:hypothetical protein IQ254_18340 [Nodosilinea sp. LEGE 07088]|uniref:hypothetical protein n=1 Tax=Nodosilinea sp. LEGE 07088 TaxID=2777968 RepID=UPI00188058DC|nr:hypothetical protein [Nodosilinea sp. LEGE 07088]MBE9139130.1 hypothetical protein [Nodosilinea sp. LEGE 07088]
MVDSELLCQNLSSPLQRLNVYDGLGINARRWAIDHTYHRRRQNLHFQALFESGIVYGLGVQLISPPELAQAEYRQSRCWIEIQPGIAIDQQGNPIILHPGADRTFPIEINPPDLGLTTIYIVLSFVEPVREQEFTGDILEEQFRIDQITTPPCANQIELCRIKIKKTNIELTEYGSIETNRAGNYLPKNAFLPQFNELDLTHRKPVKVAPSQMIRIGVLIDQNYVEDYSNLPLYQNLEDLSSCISSLYPDMRTQVELVPEDDIHDSMASTYDLLCLDFVYFLRSSQIKNLPALPSSEKDQAEKIRLRLRETGQRLQSYIKAGGRILLDTATEIVTDSVKNAIEAELFCQPSLANWQTLKAQKHPILREPFVFGAPPMNHGQVLQVSIGEQFIWISGALSALWSGEGDLKRDDIRAAQELGINLLHLMGRKRQLTSLSADFTGS